MQASEIISDIRAELIEPFPGFWTNARLLSLINLAEKDFVQETRLLQGYAFLSTQDGENEYPMPAYWMGAEKVFFNDVKEDGTPFWRPLESTTIEKLSQEHVNILDRQSANRNKPRFYFVHNRSIYLYPTPNVTASANIFMFFESKPIPLVSADQQINIDDSLSPALRAYVLSKAWDQDNETEKADRQFALYTKMVGQGHKWKKKQQLDGKWRVDPESWAPYTYSGNSTGLVNGINPLDQ